MSIFKHIIGATKKPPRSRIISGLGFTNNSMAYALSAGSLLPITTAEAPDRHVLLVMSFQTSSSLVTNLTSATIGGESATIFQRALAATTTAGAMAWARYPLGSTSPALSFMFNNTLERMVFAMYTVTGFENPVGDANGAFFGSGLSNIVSTNLPPNRLAFSRLVTNSNVNAATITKSGPNAFSADLRSSVESRAFAFGSSKITSGITETSGYEANWTGTSSASWMEVFNLSEDAA